MAKRGRKRVHNSNAEKQKAYRKRQKRIKEARKNGEQLPLFPQNTE